MGTHTGKSRREYHTEVDHTRLGGVVCSLHLRNVHDVTAHRGRGDKAASPEVLEPVAEDVGALLLLPPPVGGGRLGAVEGAVEVGVDDIQVVVNGAVHHGALGPRDTGVGDEDVEAAVELPDHLVHGILDLLGVLDVDLVGLA